MTELAIEYVRRVDDEAAAAAPPGTRYEQALLGLAGGANCAVNYIVTPAGGGSPAGLHTHVVDQSFYLLAGEMTIEVDGETEVVGPGSLIFFPAGVAHRNWNDGEAETVHLAINAPAPDPAEPFARPVA